MTEVYHKAFSVKARHTKEDAIGKDIRFEDLEMKIINKTPSSKGAKPIPLWVTLGSQAGTSKQRVYLTGEVTSLDRSLTDSQITNPPPPYYNFFSIDSEENLDLIVSISEEEGSGFRNAGE